MSLLAVGALIGMLVASGLLLVGTTLATARRPRLDDRVLPYLRDLAPAERGQRPTFGAGPSVGTGRASGPWGVVDAVFGPLVRRAAERAEQVVGGSTTIERKLRRAGLDLTVADFRVQQVWWGLGGFVVAAGYGLLRAWLQPTAPLPLLLLCLGAFLLGFVLRDNRLTAQVKKREAAITAEFPTVAELLALSVAAGESPVAALDRVVTRSGGELSRELAEVLAEIRTGVPVTEAFDRLAATTGLAEVARFAHGIAVAVERGTPLADVLHAQAADVREAGRRHLIEQASRKEIAMMVPVVFLILPVTVLFAFWPGYVGLSLSR